jgi:hypothetical protein
VLATACVTRNPIAITTAPRVSAGVFHTSAF